MRYSCRFNYVLCLVLVGAGCLVVSEAEAGTATLTWTASDPPTGVTTYRLYRATGACASNPPLVRMKDVGLVTTTTDTVPADPAQYCYAVTAYNGTMNLESIFSNTVTLTIPVPPPAPCTTITNPQQCRFLGGTWRKGRCTCP